MPSVDRKALRSVLFALLAGTVFGLGLAIAQMTDPDKILGFLDVAGRWDPSLALVMAGALAVATPGFAWVRRRGRATCGDLHLPDRTDVDRDLLAGAALFGIGWGLAGYCPGPALANLARAAPEAWLLVPMMVLGFWLGDRWARRR